MTLLVPDHTAELSVVDPEFADDGFAGHARPSLLDRAIMRLSLAMLLWARNHADRSFLRWDDLTLGNRNALEREARENATIPGPLRIL